MSLQVWIPCDGNMKNQGLAGDFTLAGTPVYGTGIVTAKALSANVQQHYYNVPELVGVTEYSMCAWIKIDASAEYNEWADILRIQAKPGASSDVARIELRNASTPGKFAVYFSKDTAVGSNTNTYWNVGGDRNEANNKWCHIAMTKNATTASLYIDGKFIASQPCSAFEKTPAPLSGYISIGQSTSAKCPAYVNDFRVYDHCLSPKEVEQIARGLVIHYPLSVDGGNNLLLHTDINTYGKGYFGAYNGGTIDVVNNITYNGSNVYKIAPSTSTTSSGASCYYDSKVTLHPGNTYTYSCMIYSTVADTFSYSSLGHFQSYTSDAAHHSTRVKENDPIPANQWTHVSIVFTVSAESVFRSFFIYFANISQVIYVCNIKLEIGDHATPWTPSIADTNFARMGLNSTIIDDTSGMGHHGTAVGSPTYVTNTPRYPTGMNFNGSSQRIQTPLFALPQDFSVSFWMKRNATTNSRQFLFTGWTGISCELAADNTPFFRVANTGDSPHGAAITADSGWVHYCGVYTHATSIELYINGKSVGKTSSTKLPNIVATSGNLAFYNNTYFNGEMSDFRIYATALTASDVLELYNTSASLSNNGTMFANEFIE